MTAEVLNQAVKQTALYNTHINLGAKLVPFGGYIMPVSYPDGIQSEYFAVRNEAGLFDVSHMGEFFISGEGAEEFLQLMTINDVSKLKIGEAQYSAMCYPEGGIVDDLILYRKSEGYFMVVNAANIQKDFDWLFQYLPGQVTLENVSEEYSLIAIQGPNSRDILSAFTPVNLNIPFYTFTDGLVCDYPVMLSRTGYTGELGFEIYGSTDAIVVIWDALVKAGAKPAGLAARDILRLEMKYCLYGNDIDKATNPIEAGLSWVTSFDKNDFIGKTSLLEKKKNGQSRLLVAFIMDERGIPRQGYEIFLDLEKRGVVTSGSQSPKLNLGIGLGYVNKPYHKSGQQITVKIRNKLVGAHIIKPPFIKDTSLHF
jgi:aminomethyltransferase